MSIINKDFQLSLLPINIYFSTINYQFSTINYVTHLYQSLPFFHSLWDRFLKPIEHYILFSIDGLFYLVY
ncbi:unnamed protein product [Meloidogyne enterolobii]|uniref:Uncharacterized protein n=1 Tax=Meloidogyne enterolobii TaxID=390850 RepID=A0ACB0ZFV5_MELEN